MELNLIYNKRQQNDHTERMTKRNPQTQSLIKIICIFKYIQQQKKTKKKTLSNKNTENHIKMK